MIAILWGNIYACTKKQRSKTMKTKIFSLLLAFYSFAFPQIMEFALFPFTDPAIKEAHPVVFNTQKIMMTYVLRDTLRYSLTTDGGLTWQDPVNISYFGGLSSYSAIKLNSGRIIIICAQTSKLWKIISDDEGMNWTISQIPISFLVPYINFVLTQTDDNKLWLTMSKSGNVYYMTSTDNGDNWTNPVILVSGNKKFLSITSTSTGKLIACYQDSISGDNNIFMMSSTDEGITWSTPIAVASTNLSEEKPRLIKTDPNTVYLIYQILKPTPFSRFKQYDIYYLKTTDGGNSWLGNYFTKFIDDDILLGAYKYGDKPLITFFSKRYSGERLNRLFTGIIETSIDDAPPMIYKIEISPSNISLPLVVRVYALDDEAIDNVKISLFGGEMVYLYDDGMHNDSLPNDFIYGNALDAVNFNFENFLVVNNIKLPLSNNGVIADVQAQLSFTAIVTDNRNKSVNLSRTINFGSGGSFDNIPFLYSGGFLLSGYNGSFLWANGMATSSRISDYLPGKVGSDPNNPKNKLYALRKNDPPFGPSWQNWRDAVSLGAYFYDGDNDGIYNPVDKNGNGLWDPNEDMPDIFGDETFWCVYNDGVPSSQRRYNDVPPQGIEIRQTVFASKKPQLNNTVFIRYSILNRGTVTNLLDSVYFSVWTDPDLGNYSDDLVGSDTLLNSGFTYNNGPDGQYGSNPPAFFTTLLQGPWVYTGNILDTAFNHLGKLLGEKIFIGYKNIPLFSFMQYYQSNPIVLSDPSNRFEARYYTLGQNRSGQLINPCNWPFGEVRGGINCATINPRFLYSGDPVTNFGWIMTISADVRMMLNVGPFQLQANNPVDIIIAYTVGRGSDHLNSITVARNLVNAVLNEYRSNFSTITDVEDDLSALELSSFVLYQNYPNPFNQSTKIKYQVARSGNVTLKVYDILGREVATIVNEEKKPGVYEVEFNGSALSSGVYFYKLNAGDFTQIKKLLLLK
jgi:hypothetical protein